MALPDLCTLADVKQWLGITDALSDALLTSLITRSSQGIRTWLARDLTEATLTENYDGTGTSRLSLRAFPVTAVSSVIVNGLVVPAASSPVVYGYMFDKFGIYLTGLNAVGGNLVPNMWVGSYFPRANQNVQVVYTAGFNPMPDDITQACIEQVGYKSMQRKHIGKKSENISAGGMGTSYQEGLLAPEVRGMLGQYRKVIPN